MTPFHDLELQLQRDAAALRGLARDLIGDAHAADDVVQEAMQKTLQRPPADHSGLGAWLQTVVTRLCFQHHRRQKRRSARELTAAQPERLEPTIDIVARREALRSVTAAVFALEEPYQSTILLRYFEDLSPMAIAARTKTNLATVKSRLQRGLQLLRAKMSGEGERRDWKKALAAATGLPPMLTTTTLVTTGALLMGPTAKIALGAAAIAAGAALVYALTTDSVTVAPAAAQASAPLVADAKAQSQVPAAKPEEQRVAVPTEEPEPSVLAHPFAYDLQVEVRDRDGLPVSGAQVYLAPIGCALSRVPTTTGTDGIVHAQWHGKLGEMEMALLVEDQPMLRRFMVRAGATQRLAVEGRNGGGGVVLRFVSGNGNAGQGTLSFVADGNGKDLGQALTLALTESILVSGRNQTSDLQMKAGLHPNALFADALLLAPTPHEEQHEGAVRLSRELPVLGLQLSASSFEISMQDSTSKDGGPPPTILEGIVYDEDGKPVAKSTVCWGEFLDLPTARARTDDQGRFRFENVKPGTIEVRAGGRDAGLAHARVDIGMGKTTTWQARLRKESIIRGRAVDNANKPLEGWTIEVVGAQNPWFDACAVRKDGTFVLPNQPGGISTLLLRPNGDKGKLPVMTIGNVLPDSGEVLVQFDATTVAGQMQIVPLVPEGLPVQAEVRVWQEETGRGASMAKADNSPVFAIQNLPAGWYRVEVGATSLGWVDAGRHWVDGKGLVDLGKVGLGQPGKINVAYPEGSVMQGEQFEQQICQRRPGLDLRVEDATTAKGKTMMLPAGDYWLLWRDAQGHKQVRPFQVEAGKETAVDTAVTAGH